MTDTPVRSRRPYLLRAMHEWIRVYVDDEMILRADHNLDFYGFRFLTLHYKMKKKVSDQIPYSMMASSSL